MFTKQHYKFLAAIFARQPSPKPEDCFYRFSELATAFQQDNPRFEDFQQDNPQFEAFQL